MQQDLIDKGHDVHVVASNRAYHFLSNYFPNTTKIPGGRLKYEDNRLKKLGSFMVLISQRKTRT